MDQSEKRRIEILKLKFIQDLYIRINAGNVELPPPPQELIAPNGDLLYMDEDFRKNLKKLKKRRQKLLKQKDKETPAEPGNRSLKCIRVAPAPQVKIEPESELPSKQNSLRIYDHDTRGSREIKRKNVESQVKIIDANKRTRSVRKSGFSQKISTEIENDKKLIILLERMSNHRLKATSDDKGFNTNSIGSDFDEGFNSINPQDESGPSVTNKKRKSREKLDIEAKARRHEKIPCSHPNCPALIARSTMPLHIRSHERNGDKVRIQLKNRPKDYEKGKKCQCQYCGQIFQHLDYHISIAHSEDGPKKLYSSTVFQHKKLRPVSCSVCFQNFENEISNEYILHMKHHDSKWQISCSFCQDKYHTFDDYSKHLATLHPYQCPILECNETYIFLNGLREHMRENHTERCKEFGINPGGKITYLCSSCPASFSNANLFRDHLYVHDDPSQVTCTICNRIFKRRKLYRAHMRNSHGELTIKCTSDGCDKMFSSLASLRQHLYYHKPDSPRVTYRYFKKNVTKKQDLLLLKKEGVISPEYKTYKCEKEGCCIEFPDNSRFSNHMTVFHGQIDKSANQDIISCPIDLCKAKSHHRKVLNLHIKYDHPELASSLVKNAEKKFKCSFCERSYNYQHALKDHEISHTDPEQTTCELCNKYHTSKLLKNSHLKEAHGEKNFKCSYPKCSKTFAQEVNLRRHFSLHPQK